MAGHGLLRTLFLAAGRLGEHTRLGGVNPNDLKIAGCNTGQAFSLFEYTGRECGGPPPRLTPPSSPTTPCTSSARRWRGRSGDFESP